MKCNHKICKVEDIDHCPPGFNNWREAFEHIEKVCDHLYDQNKYFMHEYSNLQEFINELKKEAEKHCKLNSDLIEEKRLLETEKDTWKNRTYIWVCMFALMFAAWALTFVCLS